MTEGKMTWTNDLGHPLWPGQAIEWHGEKWNVGAVLSTGGERYYQLVRKGEVAMMPASEVEAALTAAGGKNEQI